MSVPQSISDVLKNHVVLEVECIDRMYLNVYVKRQLDKAGISYEALDNGILACNNRDKLRKISNSLTSAKINKLLRNWN